jgi:hypothetical protein
MVCSAWIALIFMNVYVKVFVYFSQEIRWRDEKMDICFVAPVVLHVYIDCSSSHVK